MIAASIDETQAVMDAYLAALVGREDIAPYFSDDAAFELVDVDGLTYQEAADVLDVPLGTVMSRLHRGKKMLRKSLADYAAEEGYDVSNKTGASND